MRFALIVVLLGMFNFAQAKVTETQPELETPNLQAELMDELETTSEDLEFDTEDEIFLSSDETLILDPEIERITTETTPAPKIEAKAENKTTTTKKK